MATRSDPRSRAGRKGSREILVAHDARPLGHRLAAEVAGALAANGWDPLRVVGAIPTPVVAHAVGDRHAAAGLVLTASHNPASDHGVKVIGPQGQPLSDRDKRRIEGFAGQALRAGSRSRRSRRAKTLDPTRAYLSQLERCLEFGRRPVAGLTVHYDALGGAGASLLPGLLARAGARVEQRSDGRAEWTEGAPDPSPTRLRALVAQVRRGRGLRVGLATDGDADRFAVVDETGDCLNATEAFALVVDHLAATGRVRGGVGVSPALGSLVTRVAHAHGLAVERLPMGFSHASRALREGRVELAGDESGGVGWARAHCDKDGLLACALLADRLGARRLPLSDDRRSLRRLGSPHCERRAVAAAPAALARLAAWAERPPARVGRDIVQSTQTNTSRSSLRLGFRDGFLMLRASGTEAVVRIYAEATTARGLAQRLALGEHLLVGKTRVDGVSRSR